MKDNARQFAIERHGNQIRKSNGKKIIYHPIAVGNILEELGYDDEIISAGYLHDTVEDTPTTIEEIRTNFGNKIAELVFNASEHNKSLPWEERKKHTISVVKNNSIEDIVVVLADKIHNIEDLTNELRIQGLTVFNSFRKGIEKQLWYFEGIYNAIDGVNRELPIAKRLESALTELKSEISFQIELENEIFADNKEL